MIRSVTAGSVIASANVMPRAGTTAGWTVRRWNIFMTILLFIGCPPPAGTPYRA